MIVNDFKHRTQLRVRNYEVDWQGIVHNAIYLQYFEVGRIDYLKKLGVRVDLNSIQHESRVVLVRNEVNYRSPARFDELLNVHTRITSIRNTSFTFEGFIVEDGSLRAVAENVAVHVWLSSVTGEPQTVPEHFRSTVAAFEGASFTDLRSLTSR